MKPAEPPILPLVQPAAMPVRAGVSPLWAVFLFTFANSLGSGVVTNGIVFMSRNGYGFSDRDNSWLMVMLGATYILGALATRPLVDRLRAFGIGTRGLLAGLMVVAAVLCFVPQAVLWLGWERQAWTVWLVVGVYSPLTGVLWPLVESYVSGGRSGAALRTVTSRWNICWSSAVVVATFGISPFVASQPAMTIFVLGLVHLVCLIPLSFLHSNPAPHLPDEHEPHPPVYGRLLVTFRLLLPMSYIVSSALGPYLPGAMAALGVPVKVQAITASSWLIARVVVFVVLNRWHGWHGRWYPAVLGGLLLVGGFGAAVFAKPAGSVGLLVAGLALFGTGMAVVYSGALYYALEVGQAEVEAGGKHEALIGMGYTVGPGVLLMAGLGVERGWIGSAAFEPVVLGFVGALAVFVAGLVVYRVLAHVKTPQNGAQ
jgi:MFS family permease